MSHDDVTADRPDASARSRRENALRREDLANAAADREAREAQELIDEFIAQAERAGIKPEPLRMHLSGGGTARTDKFGWYIKVNQTVAIGSDGGYYILTMPGGLKERLSGVALVASQPSLQVSRGGRDGESGDLSDFLTRRLRHGDGGQE